MAGFWLTVLIFVPTLGAFGILMQSDEGFDLALRLHLFVHPAGYQPLPVRDL
jgi:hypothetical protein